MGKPKTKRAAQGQRSQGGSPHASAYLGPEAQPRRALIRGKKVDKALAELTFSRKRIAGSVKKTLESAIANAENNHDLDVDSLVVAEAYVGDSLVMKRFHARARGRASRVEKPFSHLTIVVRQVEEDRIMGQKINPIGLRLGINRTWDSRWFANKGEYGKLLQEDLKIRETLIEDLKQAAVSKIVIERPHRSAACRSTPPVRAS
jgi:large subunit ribosomal protein L22